MSAFDQGFFDFDAPGSDDGWRKWREQLDARQREFEHRWGVSLRRRVTACLRDHAKPVHGRLEWLNPHERNSPPRFRIGTLEFSHDEIESLVPQDGDASR